MLKNPKKFILTLAMVLYLLTLFWFTLGSRTPSYNYGVNLVPFHTIVTEASNAAAYGAPGSLRHAILYDVLNLLMLAPFGFLLPLLSKKMQTYKRFFWTPLLLSIFIELCQYLAHLGACDVDDVLLNFTGATLGFFAAYLLRKLIHNHKEKHPEKNP